MKKILFGTIMIATLFTPFFVEARLTAHAICRDNTYSYSVNRRGTCSWHGGVKMWLR